jgi:hypothetical protein
MNKKSPPVFKKYKDMFGKVHKILFLLHTYIVLQIITRNLKIFNPFGIFNILKHGKLKLICHHIMKLEGLLKSLGLLMKQFSFVCAVPVNISVSTVKEDILIEMSLQGFV